MDTGIVFLPSLIFETCFIKTVKNFESLLADIFKSLNQSASFESSFSGFSLNLKTYLMSNVVQLGQIFHWIFGVSALFGLFHPDGTVLKD